MISIPRLIGGLSFLCILIGALLVCFVEGGFFNPYTFQDIYFGIHHQIRFDRPLHITGFILGIVGAVGFAVLFSFKRPDKNQPSKPDSDAP
jgi:hypothetical protein